jgi:hypothetical protein
MVPCLESLELLTHIQQRKTRTKKNEHSSAHSRSVVPVDVVVVVVVMIERMNKQIYQIEFIQVCVCVE